jgi:hypothetical protein
VAQFKALSRHVLRAASRTDRRKHIVCCDFKKCTRYKEIPGYDSPFSLTALTSNLIYHSDTVPLIYSFRLEF